MEEMTEIEKETPKTFSFSKDPLIRGIQVETRMKNQSVYLVFTGRPGSGKSYALLETLRMVDPNFNTDRIAFTNEEFIALLKLKLPPGSAIMYDEVGVGMDSREFMSVINKVLSYVTMTMRYKRLVIGMSVPSMNWIDLKTRELLHIYIELQKKFINGVSYGKWQNLQTNYKFGKTYYKSPRITQDGKPFSIGQIGFKLPPKYLTEPYELRKSVFGDEVLKSAEDAIRASKYKKLKRMGDSEIMESVKDNKAKYLTKDKLDINKIGAEFCLGKERKRELVTKFLATGVMRESKK